MANKIIENVRENGYKYKEIGIITKNIDTYSGLIKAIFRNMIYLCTLTKKRI